MRLLRLIDRTAGWLLVLAGLAHGAGAYLAYGWLTPTLVWAWSGTLAALLLAALNLLRAGRPDDRRLAWVAFAGCAGWYAISFAFARTLPSPWDFRPITHMVLALILAVFSLRGAIGRPL